MSNKIYSKYRTENSFEKRKADSSKVLAKYPDRIPIICEVSQSNDWAIKLDKIKYLVPYDVSVGQFLNIIRKRIKLGSEQGLFLFINGGGIPSCVESMKMLYNQYGDNDGFLYLNVAVENTFG